MILDILARKPFWDRDLNFNHGTGHGVGYLLNIHEGPAGFRWKYRKGETEVLQEGMVITDEPGIYIEGSHGIRLENELLTCKGTLNEYVHVLRSNHPDSNGSGCDQSGYYDTGRQETVE